jgi:MoxR-like ATPase
MAAKATTAAKPPKPVPPVAKQFIPTGSPEIVNMDRERQAIAIAMLEDIPTILVGHTGTAKTKLLQRLHEDAKWPYRSIAAHGQIEVDTLVGKWTATKDKGMEYKLGILPFNMKHGIATGIQEINVVLPEVLILLHEFVDEGFITLSDLDPEHPDFVITPHPNFRLYGTMNPPELYPGTRELSPALTRRCIIRQVEPLQPHEEVEVLKQQAPWIDNKTATSMTQVAQSVRQQFDAGQGLFWLSTADLVMWSRLIRHISPYDAAEIAVMGKAPQNELDFVRGRVRLAFDPNAADADDDGF